MTRRPHQVWKDFLIGGVIFLAMAVIGLQAPIWWGEHGLRKTALAEAKSKQERKSVLSALAFEDVIEYHAIVPPKKTVNHGSYAKYASIMERKPVIERLVGGVRLEWTEEIYCDMDPTDGSVKYDYYAEAQPTGATFNKASLPIAREDIGENDGFFVRQKRSPGQVGKLEPIKYPSKAEAPNGADCVLRSGMIMGFEGQLRWIEMQGEVVHVRDLS